MLRRKIKNKKAEVGLTMTWIIATIIIVISISFFIFFADLLAKETDVKATFYELTGIEDFDFSGWVKEKTILAFSLNTNNDEIIDPWIKGEENE